MQTHKHMCRITSLKDHTTICCHPCRKNNYFKTTGPHHHIRHTNFKITSSRLTEENHSTKHCITILKNHPHQPQDHSSYNTSLYNNSYSNSSGSTNKNTASPTLEIVPEMALLQQEMSGRLVSHLRKAGPSQSQ